MTPRAYQRAIGALLLAALTMGAHAASPERCDFNDDGRVSFADASVIFLAFGARAGELRYLDALDLDNDGDVDINDYRNEFVPCFGNFNVATDPTTFSGQVIDGIGNPLPGVHVEVEDSSTGATAGTTTGADGHYAVDTGAISGKAEVTFNGDGAVDPTPGGALSGEYPTIPHKPAFVNRGLDNVFRIVSLPERDHNGGIDLGGPGFERNGQTFTLLDPAAAQNAGVGMLLPAGCTITLPDGFGGAEIVSIARVDPALLPIPMPPDLSSSLFVTFQPGGTLLDCSGATEAPVVTFDNNDQYDPSDMPFLAGVVDGVFAHVSDCAVLDVDGDSVSDDPDDQLFCDNLTSPFEFAWYHVDIPLDPCDRTTVAGIVVDDSGPVNGATVSVSGVVPDVTGPDGTFSIPNVPAGPNGPACNTRPFNLQGFGSEGGRTGRSARTVAVPGGITNVGEIDLDPDGMILGNVSELVSAAPFIVQPRQSESVGLYFGGFSGGGSGGCFGDQCTLTDTGGNYKFNNVQGGFYTITLDNVPQGGFFSDPVSQDVQLPDNGTAVANFYLVGRADVIVHTVDQLGDPLPFSFVDIFVPGRGFGANFVSQDRNLGASTGPDGLSSPIDLPLGTCEIQGVFSEFAPGPLPVISVTTILPDGTEVDGCETTQALEPQELRVQVEVPDGGNEGDIGNVQASLVNAGNDIQWMITYPEFFFGNQGFFFFGQGQVAIDIQVPDDGLPGGASEVDNLVGNSTQALPTNLNPDFTVRCDVVTDEITRIEFCELIDENTGLTVANTFANPDLIQATVQNCVAGPGEDVIITVDLASIGFPFAINAAVGSRVQNQDLASFVDPDETFAEAAVGRSFFTTLDQAPNGGSFEVIEASGGTSDPLGDTFPEDFFGVE